MNTPEFVRKLRRWARKRGIYFDVKTHESKGSHRTLHLGTRKTTVPWTTKDLTTGTVRAVLKQLGVDASFAP
jgi:mRNA interferase HicA